MNRSSSHAHRSPRRAGLVAGCVSLALTGGGGSALDGVAFDDTVSGVVVDAEGPVAGAVIRQQGTENSCRSDRSGRFRLTDLPTGSPITVTAWKHAYYCSRLQDITPPARDLEIELTRYQSGDDPDYTWLSPTGSDEACQSCHQDYAGIWLKNAHAGAATNPRFLSMYNGTDLAGNRSPLTRRLRVKDYGEVPQPPDPTRPYYGPGFKLDFPRITGNCAACHVPGAAVDKPYGTDPGQVSGADRYGVHCDYCHKVASVVLDPETGRPYPNRPGVLSSDVRRPHLEADAGHQLFFGPLDDVNADEGDSRLPLIEESQFCAPCHFGVFWDRVIYNSFGEWLESPYSDPETGKTCQRCHMPAPAVVDGVTLTNLAPKKGGVERKPQQLHAHLQRGPGDEAFMRQALRLDLEAKRGDDGISVEATITNHNTGHHVPTGSPLRQLLLLIDARDAQGQPLQQLAGPTVPAWGGAGDPAQGYYAGLPGQGYAKILKEKWTQVTPTGAYWNPTILVSDNRIPAMGSDSTAYTFAGSRDTISITATLYYRRAFKELMDQKSWDVPDLLMLQREIDLSTE